MARKFGRRSSRVKRIMAVLCILILFALAATIYFGEKKLRDRENEIKNYGTVMTWGEIS